MGFSDFKLKKYKRTCGAVLAAASISVFAPHACQAAQQTWSAQHNFTLKGLSGLQSGELTAVQALAQSHSDAAVYSDDKSINTAVFKSNGRDMSAKADIKANTNKNRAEQKKAAKKNKQAQKNDEAQQLAAKSGSLSSRINAILASDDDAVFVPVNSGSNYDFSQLGSDSIMGGPVASEEQCVRYLLEMNPNPQISVSPEELVHYYYEEAEREGIRPDAAFAQALKETGYFNYGGTVTPDQNNYCGLGTTSATVKGAYFDTAQLGVRAHIQHLLAYSSVRPPREDVVDPRYSLVRSVYGGSTIDTWEGLNGRWAVPGNNYGQEILQIVNRMARE